MKILKLLILTIIFTVTDANLQAKYAIAATAAYYSNQATCQQSGGKWKDGICSYKKGKKQPNYLARLINAQAEKLVAAINNHDAQATFKLFSISDQTFNLQIVTAAMSQVPDNSAFVRCAASNPDCGLSSTGKILKAVQQLLQGKGKISQSFIDSLFYSFDKNFIQEETTSEYSPTISIESFM